MGYSSLPLTAWKVDGATGTVLNASSSFSSNGSARELEIPEVNTWAWGLNVAYGFAPITLAARVTFACASSDPCPMPGQQYMSWKYAGRKF